MSDILPDLRFYGAKRKWPKGLHVMPYLLTTAADEITRLRTALSEAEQRVNDARRQALGDATQAIFTMGAWYPTFADKRIPCTFDEGTSAAYKIVRELEGQAERALIPSEPHDAEGRE